MNPFTVREAGCGSGQAAETVRPRLGAGIREERELHVKVKFSSSQGKPSGQASAKLSGARVGVPLRAAAPTHGPALPLPG